MVFSKSASTLKGVGRTSTFHYDETELTMFRGDCGLLLIEGCALKDVRFFIGNQRSIHGEGVTIEVG